MRWFSCALILMPFAAAGIGANLEVLLRHWKRLLALGFLGMWICGALVYLALKYTSATNGTLIYTTSPVMIILLERIFGDRRITPRQALGIGIAMIGVLVIIFRGDWAALMAMRFNTGDLLFVLAAVSWSIYSVILKSTAFEPVPTLSLFTIIAVAGAVTLAPFCAAEIVYRNTFPAGLGTWLNITGIIVFASLIAFSSYQFGVRRAGASVTGIFMYLMPVYGVLMAVVFLKESFQTYHFWGIVATLAGVIMATFPTSLLAARKRQTGPASATR